MIAPTLRLIRPVGKCASEFFDVLLCRGLVYGQTLDEARHLATSAEWDRYAVSCRIGAEQSWVMRVLHTAPEPTTFSATATEAWDDEIARDERDYPPTK